MVFPEGDLARRVLACAAEVHEQLGPGLAHYVYKNRLAIELTRAGLPFERGRVLRPEYDGRPLDLEFDMDFVVADALVVEVETAERLDTVSEAQLRTYVRFGPFPMGLTVNFNAAVFEEGVLHAGGEAPRGWVPPPEGADIFDDPDLWDRSHSA